MISNYKQYGFNPELVKVSPEDYQFGSALPYIVLKEDGNYDDFLPIYEPQAEKWETAGCTIWGSQNQIEIYFKYLFGFEPNYSERFNYILAGVTLAGANPQNAYESIRKEGLIDHKLLPIPDTYEEFLTPKPMTEELKKEGLKWLKDYEIKHEWITSPTQKDIKAALRYSPVALSVTAWIEENGLYIDNGLPNTHWCVCYGYLEDERGLILKIFDSYDHSIKLLHPDHKIFMAKRILIKKKEFYPSVQGNWLFDIFRSLWNFIRTLFDFPLEK